MDSIARQDRIVSITSNSGDEERAILEWLSPLEPRERHQAIGRDRMPGVGDWLLHTNEFTQWDEGGEGAAKPVLFCYGDPGVGKTYLSSLVIDRLCDQAYVGNMAVACVYCDFTTKDEQSATGLLGVLLKQVVLALYPIPDRVQKAFESSKRGVGGRRLLLADILSMLSESLPCLRRVFICIDALDEFPAKHRPELWESLQKVVRMCPNTRLFITGRLHIRDEVQRYFPSTAEMLPISSSTHDIELYLKMRLSRDSEPDSMDEELEADILRIIPEVVSGTFLLASLNMDAVLAEATIYQRGQALHRITKGLGLQDAYDKTLDRIRQQGGSKSRLGIEALMWISCCERPLRSQELCHALGVELKAEDFSIRNVPSIRTVLGYTLGLAITDEQGSTPRLLHFTLQEYLGQHPTLFVTAHSMIAEICLTYLNCRLVRALPPDPHRALQTLPFLEYSTCSWGTHAARGLSEPVKSLALELLSGYENHVSATVLWRREVPGFRMKRDIQGISGLHCVVSFGITEIASTMLETKGWQLNGRDSMSRTPLMWAIEYGNKRMMELFLGQEDIEPDIVIEHGRTVLSFASELGNEDAVKLLLERGDVNPDSMDINGRTPLSFAAGEGREGVVKLLLERGDVGPNLADGNGQTPLSFAAKGGEGGVVKLLLERGDISPDSTDDNGRTALSFAVEREDESVVELLLQRGDINPNSADRNGRTPLSFAAGGGDQGVVRLLLQRGDINPDSADTNGRTPLSFAAEKLWHASHNQHFSDIRNIIYRVLSPRDEVIVRLFLERGDVDPNIPDDNGRTPLSFAAGEGRKGLVRILLQREDINPDLADNNGRTPLAFAAEKLWDLDNHLLSSKLCSKFGVVVKLLLERGDVNPNLPDGNGRTLLSFAAERGHEGLVKLFLQRSDVNPNLADSNGRTPLSFTAEKIRDILDARFRWDPCSEPEVVMKLLLERGDVNPNSPDGNGRTPLSFVAERGQEGLVKLLLERGDVDPDSTDSNGRTPLSFAAEGGHESVVELLLQRGDINPNSADSNGRTPLLFAAGRGDKGVVRLLLQRRDINPNSTDSNGRTPLSFVAEGGQGGLVKLLLERGDVDPNSADSKGRTPLSFAAEGGHKSVVELFLQRGDISPDSADNNGRTPLSFAAQRADKGVVKLLLQRGDINPNLADNNGRTPLSFATENTDEGVVKLLLQRGDINPNIADSNGRTPLSLAAGRGQKGIVKLLLQRGDVNPDSADSNGRTPLSFAAEQLWASSNPELLFVSSPEPEVVVKLLLERGDVDPDSTDSNGRTPLSFAAEQGQGGVVELLLERGDVDPDSTDSNGRTPLSFAAGRGWEGIVKLLLQRGDINPDSTDSNGRTPLSFAAEQLWDSSNLEFLFVPFPNPQLVVKLLLERGDVDPDSTDSNGRTPLSFAAEQGQGGVVKLLLERGDVDPDSTDSNGRTPLSFAAEQGQGGVVELLLENGDVNPDLSDNTGQKPLSYAIMKGHKRIVKSLSGSRTPNRESPENRVRIPASAIDWNVSLRQVTPPLTAIDPGPVRSWPPLEQPLPLLQFLPDQLHSPPAPHLPTPTPGSTFAFPCYPLISILLIFLFFTLMISHGYGDSLELFHAIRPACQ